VAQAAVGSDAFKRYWKSRFGPDPGVLNQGVLGQQPAQTVVGVVGRASTGFTGFGARVYIPITMLPSLILGSANLESQRLLDQTDAGEPGMSRSAPLQESPAV